MSWCNLNLSPGCRGPLWNRPSAQLTWGDSLLAGWGPLEQVDLAGALGAVPIIGGSATALLSLRSAAFPRCLLLAFAPRCLLTKRMFAFAGLAYDLNDEEDLGDLVSTAGGHTVHPADVHCPSA